MVAFGRSGAWVQGSCGSVEIDAPIFDMHRFAVRTYPDGMPVETVHEHPAEHGHRFMLDHVHECLVRGRLESPMVRWQFSLGLAEAMEQVLDQVGVTRSGHG